MQVALNRWGNSAGIRIPISVIKELNLSYGEKIDLKVENGRVILEPVRNDALMQLLNQITPENLHGEISTGNEVGNEIIWAISLKSEILFG